MTSAFIAQLATVTVGLLHVLMACATWLLLRGPRQARVLHLWASGTLALGAWLAMSGLGALLPEALATLLRDVLLPALLVAALLLRVLALRQHMGRALHLEAVLSMAALAGLGWLLCLQSGDARVPQSFANAVLAVGTAVTARHAWNEKRGSGARTARWLLRTETLLTEIGRAHV